MFVLIDTKDGQAAIHVEHVTEIIDTEECTLVRFSLSGEPEHERTIRSTWRAAKVLEAIQEAQQVQATKENPFVYRRRSE